MARTRGSREPSVARAPAVANCAAGILAGVRTDPRMLLRGLVKFVAVVVVAGLAGAGIGIALAELSGNDGASEPLLPATSQRASTSTGRTATTTSTATSTTAAKAVYRVPRVQIAAAQLGPVSESTGRALVAVRVRVTNRGNRPLTIKTPALLSGQDEVPLGSSARDAAGALLRPIDSGATAAGVLRFTAPSDIAQRLTANPGARLRIQNRVVVLKLTTQEPTG